MVVKPSEGHPSEQNVGVFVCVCVKLYSQGIQYMTMRDQDWIYEQTSTTHTTVHIYCS